MHEFALLFLCNMHNSQTAQKTIYIFVQYFIFFFLTFATLSVIIILEKQKGGKENVNH